MKERKLTLFIAESLDGYIATTDHKLEWLFAVAGEDDNGFGKFYDTIDTILLGRVTYEWILANMPGEFPYKGKKCYVFSRQKQEDKEDVTFIHENAVEFVKKLKKEQGQNIWLAGGGGLISTFIAENVIDEMIITIAPVLLGDGIPLFKANSLAELKLSIKKLTQYNQFVELHYVVENKVDNFKRRSLE